MCCLFVKLLGGTGTWYPKGTTSSCLLCSSGTEMSQGRGCSSFVAGLGHCLACASKGRGHCVCRNQQGQGKEGGQGAGRSVWVHVGHPPPPLPLLLHPSDGAGGCLCSALLRQCSPLVPAANPNHVASVFQHLLSKSSSSGPSGCPQLVRSPRGTRVYEKRK